MLTNTGHRVPSLPGGLILEGIVTTMNEDGTPNVAPMGPIVDPEFNRILLRPFNTAATYRNLKRTGQGVLHVTDDVELIARAAVGCLDVTPTHTRAAAVDGVILSGACRWYAFRVQSVDDREERTEIVARVVDRGRLREFFGFNRAKHAVIEGAILATRTDFLPAAQINADMERLSTIVMKTGGQQEHRAFEFLRQTIAERLAAARHGAEDDGG